MSKKTKLPSTAETLKNKIDLKKSEKEIDGIKQEINKLNKLEDAERKKIDEMRTSIFLPKEIHKKIKIYCAQEGTISMKEFITHAIIKSVNEIIID